MTNLNTQLTSSLSSICFIITSIFWVTACVGIMCCGIFYRDVVVISTSGRWWV